MEGIETTEASQLEKSALRLLNKITPGQKLMFEDGNFEMGVKDSKNPKEGKVLTLWVKEGDKTDAIRFSEGGDSRLYPATHDNVPHRSHWITLEDLAANSKYQDISLADGKTLHNPGAWLDWISEQLLKAVGKIEGLENRADVIKLKMRLRAMEVKGTLTPDVIRMVNAALNYGENEN